jgi:hypothetical protein
MNQLTISDEFLDKYAKARSDVLIKNLTCFIDGGKYQYSKKSPIFKASDNEKVALRFLRRCLRLKKFNLLTAEPQNLNRIIKIVERIKHRHPFSFNILTQIFDYKKFKDDSICFWELKPGCRKKLKKGTSSGVAGRAGFLKDLNISCCPYCNRNYIMKADINVTRKAPEDAETTTKEITVKPALDHYWSKSDYPYLAISLYNLIPSCNLCNSIIKRDYELEFDKHIHPYSHSFHKKASFFIEPTDGKAFNHDPDSFKIKLKEKDFPNSSRAAKSAEFFGLEDLYNQHKDYVAEIIVKAQQYNPDWLSQKLRQELLILDDDALRYYFGNYLNEKGINKRPLSKLTIDICKDLGLID